VVEWVVVGEWYWGVHFIFTNCGLLKFKAPLGPSLLHMMCCEEPTTGCDEQHLSYSYLRDNLFKVEIQS